MTPAGTPARPEGSSGSTALPPAARGFGTEARRDGATCRLSVIGEMDMSNVGLVDMNLTALAANQPQVLVLDLRQLSFMDSSGLRLVLNWATRSELEGFKLCLIQGGPEIRRVFEITGTLDRLTFVDADTLEPGFSGDVRAVPVATTAPAPVGDAS